MPRRRTGGPDDPFAEMAAQARGERVTLYGVDPEAYARRLARTIDDVDQREGDAVLEVLKSIAGYKRDLGAALAYEQRKGLATGFRIDNVDRVTRQIDDVTRAWVANATGLTQDHLRQVGDLGFDFLPTAIRKAGGVPVRQGAGGARNQWATNEFDIEVPSVSRRQLAVAFGGYQADLVQNLGKIARTEIAAAVRAGVVGELAPGAVMSRIRAFLDTPERGEGRYGPLAYQAERVVRTETMRVFNAANDASSRFLRGRLGDDGMIEVWNHSSLPGSRPNHAALDGFAVKAGAKFTVGGVECSGPHDPALPAGEVINCRCTKFLWNERWGPVPRGPRPQGTAFFDSARAKRNGWTKGDRIAGLGSAGPGEGGEDFGKTRGKGPGPGPIPPPPVVPPTPPIAPPPPVAPIPPAIAPKPPGGVVVGNPAAGAKGKAKSPAYDPTKEYRPAAEVRADVIRISKEYDAPIADASAAVKLAHKDFTDFVDPRYVDSFRIRIEGNEAELAKHRAELAAITDPDRPGSRASMLKDWIKGLEDRNAAYRARIIRSQELERQGMDGPKLQAVYSRKIEERDALKEARSKAVAEVFGAKEPAPIGLRKGQRPNAENGEAWRGGLDAFGQMFDRRALDLTHRMDGTGGSQTTGSGTKADPWGVKFVFSESRANYNPDEDLIKVDRRKDTVVHELGHWLEEHDRGVHRKATDFLFHRIRTSTGVDARLRPLSTILTGSAYGPREVAFSDRFDGLTDDGPDRTVPRGGSVYAGKSYSWRHAYKMRELLHERRPIDEWLQDWNDERQSAGHKPVGPEDIWDATEIVSMAAEATYRNPARFAELDPEFFDWFYCLTKGIPWP